MADVICCDKTGTPTRNELAVGAIRPAEPGYGEADVLDFAALASSPEGQDPIDSVIRTMAADGKGHGHPSRKVARFTPFDPATTMAEAIAVDAGREIRVVKGALAVFATVAPMTPAAEKDLAALTLAMDFIKPEGGAASPYLSFRRARRAWLATSDLELMTGLSVMKRAR
jgi:H+-transporting ATPase